MRADGSWTTGVGKITQGKQVGKEEKRPWTMPSWSSQVIKGWARHIQPAEEMQKEEENQ